MATQPVNVVASSGQAIPIGTFDPDTGTFVPTKQNLMAALGPGGAPVTLSVDANGNLKTAGSGGATGIGSDASGAQPAFESILATFNVANPGAYFVQNQSGVTLQVIFDDGLGTEGSVSVQLLAPGAGPGTQGADTTPPMPWFTGRIQIAGPVNSQFLARHN